MSAQQIATLFPKYSKVFDHKDFFVNLDTIPNFLYYGAKGQASFIFSGDYLMDFRWVYRNDYAFRPLTKKDHKKIAAVIKGVQKDYGPPTLNRTDGPIWNMNHGFAEFSYSPRDFRFVVCDSTLLNLMFPPRH